MKIGMALLTALLAAGMLSGCGSQGAEAGKMNHATGTDGDTAADEAFPKPDKTYTRDEAVANGDVVDLMRGKYANFEAWTTFKALVDEKSTKHAKVRVTQFTIEGDPIFSELRYDGQRIRYTYDNSMDAYGSDLGRPTTACDGFAERKNSQGVDQYVLAGCDSQTGEYFSFPVDASAGD